MLSNKIKYTITISIILLAVLFFYSSCSKYCVQCKTMHRTYLLHKGIDTIEFETFGKYENIQLDLNNKLINENYRYITQLYDSIYYEDYCGNKEIEILKSSDHAKKYCYPLD
jgi:hypothetical protein